MDIVAAVNKHLDKTGAVYTDDLMRSTNQTRESVTRWLRSNGFYKPAGPTSRRWAVR